MHSFFPRLFTLLIVFISLSAGPAFSASDLYSQSFSIGWNLAGNDMTTPINVKSIFGSQAGIQTVWKWNATGSTWAFYAPTLDTAGTLSSYAASKGYSVLTTINPGDGYWVNTLNPVTSGIFIGTGNFSISLAASNLVTGWNLVATGDSISPSTFTSRVGNVTTLWAWDNVNSAWYFYAPTLATNNTLTSYIQSKGYEDFGILTLNYGMGFWVNYSGAVTSPPIAYVAFGLGGMCCSAVTMSDVGFNYSYIAFPITATNTFVPNYVGVSINPNNPGTISIYSDNGSAPNAILASSTKTASLFGGETLISADGLTSYFSPQPSAMQAVSFAGSGLSLSANTKYWVVLKVPAITSSMGMSSESAGGSPPPHVSTGNNNVMTSVDGVTWTSNTTPLTPMVILTN